MIQELHHICKLTKTALELVIKSDYEFSSGQTHGPLAKGLNNPGFSSQM